jgi:hypothetical protein
MRKQCKPELCGHEQPAQVCDPLVPDAQPVQVDSVPPVY